MGGSNRHNSPSITMKRIALVDCNNFFVSCERVFNPKLIGKPVVVLSSNDACIIARSPEAKQLGIKMGEPFFKCKDLIKRHNVFTLSSNFSLYADMSSRIMQTLAAYAADLEIYSIDEAFLHIPHIPCTHESAEQQTAYYTNWARMLRAIVLRTTGIPISIGIGTTKTLAKIANNRAKKISDYAGVFDISQHPDIDELLRTTPVSDIWGIGYRFSKFLDKYRIKNAYQFSQCNEQWVRKHMTIQGLKTMLELRGVPCLTLDETPDEKKSITVSRMFGTQVTDKASLCEALSCYISRAAEKLRKQNMVTRMITLFVVYTDFHSAYRRYDSASIQLPIPSSYTPELITYAQQCLQKLYTPGVIYKKIGILLSDFYPADNVQLSTIKPLIHTEKHNRLMQSLDNINNKQGKQTVFFAACGTKRHWQTLREKKSPAYTTNWSELLTIKI